MGEQLPDERPIDSECRLGDIARAGDLVADAVCAIRQEAVDHEFLHGVRVDEGGRTEVTGKIGLDAPRSPHLDQPIGRRTDLSIVHRREW